MKDEPTRLRERGPATLRALVEAGRRDVPPAELQDTVLEALGIGTSVAAGASVHGAVQRVIARLSAALKPAAVSKAGIGLFALATAGSAGYLAGRGSGHAPASLAATPRTGVVAASPAPPSGLSGAGLVSRQGRDPNAAHASPGADPAPPSPFRQPAALAASSTRRIAEQPPSPERVAHARSPAAVDHGAVRAPLADSPPVQEAPTAITVELESIRRVRALLDAGRPKAALVALDEYDARNPRGTFEEEAAALRVRALRAAGDDAGAERARASLAARFPRSVHLGALGP